MMYFAGCAVILQTKAFFNKQRLYQNTSDNTIDYEVTCCEY